MAVLFIFRNPIFATGGSSFALLAIVVARNSADTIVLFEMKTNIVFDVVRFSFSIDWNRIRNEWVDLQGLSLLEESSFHDNAEWIFSLDSKLDRKRTPKRNETIETKLTPKNEEKEWKDKRKRNEDFEGGGRRSRNCGARMWIVDEIFCRYKGKKWERPRRGFYRKIFRSTGVWLRDGGGGGPRLGGALLPSAAVPTASSGQFYRVSWFFFYRVFIGFYQVSPSLTGWNLVLLSFIGFDLVFMTFTGFYWVLPSFTELCRVWPSFTGFYRVLPSFTGCYLVLSSFTGLYWVILGFT